MVAQWIPAIAVNCLALCILTVLLSDVLRKANQFMTEDLRLFILMLLTNLAILLLDSGTWLLDGRAGAPAHAWNVICTVGYYLLTPLMSILYICYCDCKMGLPEARRRQLRRWYMVPMGLNLTLTLLSIQGGYLFRIDATNHYSRGSLLVLSFLFSVTLMIIAGIRLHLHIARTTSSEKLDQSAFQIRQTHSLVLFAIPPLVGVTVLIWYNGITVVWITTVISLLIVFINIQNAEIATDSLTGLFNRRQTDIYLQSLIQSPIPHTDFGLILLDLDHFKQINDRFGHNAGDRALKIMSAALQAECEKHEFCSRYGGDEFLIVTRRLDAAHIDDLLRRITLRLANACQTLRLPYSLSVSAGFAPWTPAMRTQDALLSMADAKLYAQKATMRRRSSDRPPKDGEPGSAPAPNPD